MKRSLKVIGVLLLLYICTSRLFFGLSVIEQIQGYTRKDNYWIQNPLINFNIFPEREHMSEITIEQKNGFIAQAYTTSQALKSFGTTPLKLSIGDRVTLVLSDNTWAQGEITQINMDYSDATTHLKNKDFEWYSYTIVIDEKITPQENLKEKKLYGSIIKTVDDYGLILPRTAIRDIGGKKYICTVTNSIKIPGGGWAGVQQYAIKYALREVQTDGQKVYNFGNNSPDWIVIPGISLQDEIVYAKNSGSPDVDCRRP